MNKTPRKRKRRTIRRDETIAVLDHVEINRPDPIDVNPRDFAGRASSEVNDEVVEGEDRQTGRASTWLAQHFDGRHVEMLVYAGIIYTILFLAWQWYLEH